MKTRAAVLESFGQPLQVQEIDLAPPKEGEALVKIHACGVCHTDLYTASGADPSGYTPCVLGHEGAGVVEEVGPGVTSVKPGDHVVTLFSPECRTCDHCRSGKTNICTAIRAQQGNGYLPDGTTRFSRDGEPLRHFMGTSTFSEYVVMPEIALANIDRSAKLESVCTLACGATTGLAGALWKARVEEGSTCAVFGLGMVGLGAVVGCRIAGASRIFAVDLSDDRLEMARRYGATDAVKAGDTAVQEILEATGGMGVDFSFEATGLVAVMGQAVEAARMGWGLCTVLGVAGKGETLKIVPRLLITGRKVQGGSFGGARGRTDVPRLVEMYLQGKIDLDGFVSHRLTLDQVNEGFELMERQDGIRSVIRFD